MTKLTTRQIADMLGAELRGPEDVVISGVSPLETAGRADLAFVAREALLPAAAKSRAGALLTAWAVEGYAGAQIDCPDPELAMRTVLQAIRLERMPRPCGVSPSASISPRAQLGEDVAVGSWAVVEEGAALGDGVTVYALAYVGRGARVGARTLIYPHVTILDGVEIGADCVLKPGCVIGADGFGFIQRDGRSLKMPHVGTVRIGDGVEIGSLSTVDRGMLGDTTLGRGVKIDSHCHVAHNCTVGDDCVLAGYAALSGSVKLGRGVMMAAHAGTVDHVEIGDGAVIAAGAAVIGNVEPGDRRLGAPSRPFNEQLRIFAAQGKLPGMHRRLSALVKEVEALGKRIEELESRQ